MGNNIWISTEQLLVNLIREPNIEQEYTRNLGGILRSTHWFIYDSKKGLFGDSTNIEYDWFTKEELLDCYEGAYWHRDA